MRSLKIFLVALIVSILAIGLIMPLVSAQPQDFDETQGGTYASWRFIDNENVRFTGLGDFIDSANFQRNRNAEKSVDGDYIIYSGSIRFNGSGDTEPCTRSFNILLNTDDVVRVMDQLKAGGAFNATVRIHNIVFTAQNNSCFNDDIDAFVENVRGEGPLGDQSPTAFVWRTGRLDPDTFNADPNVEPSDGSGDGGDEEAGSCEEANEGVILSWFLCSVMNFFDNTIDGLNNAVLDLLDVDPGYYSDERLQKSWAYFRNIASFMLIIIGLIMIIGQAVTKE